jgi:hypothetical protein
MLKTFFHHKQAHVLRTLFLKLSKAEIIQKVYIGII